MISRPGRAHCSSRRRKLPQALRSPPLSLAPFETRDCPEEKEAPKISLNSQLFIFSRFDSASPSCLICDTFGQVFLIFWPVFLFAPSWTFGPYCQSFKLDFVFFFFSSRIPVSVLVWLCFRILHFCCPFGHFPG